jgi:L-alanine-DL-glutamate epimerase-like enolase superfamily enzyme
VGQENDLELVRALRYESNVPFRVDANGGWNTPTALLRFEQLDAFSIELI